MIDLPQFDSTGKPNPFITVEGCLARLFIVIPTAPSLFRLNLRLEHRTPVSLRQQASTKWLNSQFLNPYGSESVHAAVLGSLRSDHATSNNADQITQARAKFVSTCKGRGWSAFGSATEIWKSLEMLSLSLYIFSDKSDVRGNGERLIYLSRLKYFKSLVPSLKVSLSGRFGT